MILKNKTIHSQSIRLKDGSVLVARPYRTITLDEKLDFDQNIWEEEVVAEKKSKGK